MGAKECARVLRGAGVLGWLGVLALCCGVPALGAQGATAPVRVLMQTDLGEIEVEVDTARAPISAANFLKYVDEGLYDGGRFHRTVRPDNQAARPVKIDVIQGAANAARAKEFLPPIPLEAGRARDGRRAPDPDGAG